MNDFTNLPMIQREGETHLHFTLTCVCFRCRLGFSSSLDLDDHLENITRAVRLVRFKILFYKGRRSKNNGCWAVYRGGSQLFTSTSMTQNFHLLFLVALFLFQQLLLRCKLIAFRDSLACRKCILDF